MNTRDEWGDEPTVVDAQPLKVTERVHVEPSRSSPWVGLSDVAIRNACRADRATCELPAVSL